MSHMFTRLTKKQEEGIARMTTYIVCLYGHYFLTSTFSTRAPIHDLRFYHNLTNFKRIDKDLAESALKSLKRHLWYLTPELVVLALFDNQISVDDKQLMAATLVSFVRPKFSNMANLILMK